YMFYNSEKLSKENAMISLPIVDSPLKTTDEVEIKFPQNPRQWNMSTDARRVPEYTLRGFLNSILPMPLRTAFLGLDADENPLLFDLMDPRPGSILIVSDRDAGKIRLVKTLLYSLIFTNPAYEIQFSLISARTSQWKFEYDRYKEYFSHFTNNYDHPAGKAILDEADWVESRQHGRNEGECRILILDGFDTLPYMDFDIRLNFEWLLEEGPYYQVWPIVMMDSRTAAEEKKWVEKFKTRIVGRLKDHHLGGEISGLPTLNSSTLLNGKEFVVKIGSREHHFYLPDSI
ncbi:MAG: hypothetical protein N2646_04255, partial [Bellilinea sp.]|nr:hypothetical protein [Bellilinea sp.]